MREYRPYKHQMGVEGPSFWREQQERRRQEQEAQGRDQPKTQDSPPSKQESMWETMFGAPPEERTSGPAVQRTEAPGPGFQRRGLSAYDPNQWFRVAEIWQYVGKTASMVNQAFVVDVLTVPTADLNQAAGEVAQFFGIPASAFQGLTLDEAWKEVLGPFLEGLERVMNQMKPFVISGSLRFEIGPETGNQLMLVYRAR